MRHGLDVLLCPDRSRFFILQIRSDKMQQEQASEVIVNCNGIEIFDNDFELAISEAC